MAFNRYILAFLIFGSFTSCGYYGKVGFQGNVYELHEGDTIFLDSVSVALYITELRSSQYDNIFFTQTDSAGHFNLILKPVPFPAIYQLTFSKRGYASAGHDAEFDFTEDYNYNQELHKPNDTEERYVFERYQKEKIYEGHYFVMALVATLAIILVFLIFNPGKIAQNIYWRILGFFKKLFQKPFEELSHAKQVEILSGAWCKKCGKCNMRNPKQEEVNGIPYVLGNCAKCGESIKIRLK